MDLLLLIVLFLVGGVLVAGGPSVADVLCGIVVFVAMFLWWALSMVGMLWLWVTYGWHGSEGTDAVALLVAIFAPIAVPMLVMGVMNGLQSRRGNAQ